MKSIKELVEESRLPPPCPLCNRPNFYPSSHHMVPKSQGGRETRSICRDCHRAIHSIFTNKELAATYHTVEALLSHETFAGMIRFIQKSHGRANIKRMRERKKR